MLAVDPTIVVALISVAGVLLTPLVAVGLASRKVSAKVTSAADQLRSETSEQLRMEAWKIREDCRQQLEDEREQRRRLEVRVDQLEEENRDLRRRLAVSGA